MIDATTPELLAYVAVVQSLQNLWQNAALRERPEFHTTIEVEVGPKNIRIVKTEGAKTESPRRCVHSFINRETGDILKAAGWKAPAPNGKRGSIFAEDHGLSKINWSGTGRLR